MRMLIVDDEVFARDAVVDSVEWWKYGLDVSGASSGEEALEMMEACPADILMTDIKMPGMDGLQLIEEVHRKRMTPGIIVLSSFNEFDLVRSAMRLGAEDYLFKPTMMPEDILDAVLKVKRRYEERTKKEKGKERKSGNDEVHTLLQKITRDVIEERMRRTEQDERLKREVGEALNYIAGHLGDKDLSLSKVALHVGMSKTYFSKIFKEEAGENFINYITGLRMESARRLYLRSDLKVYEIAEMLGYSDWHYFYNLYKKSFGHSLSREKEKSSL